MALAIDLTRAVSSAAARSALIQAIGAAPAHEPETDYLEWKSQMDLRQRHERAEASSYILGFANRKPSTAARYLDGYGYLVIGTEPGSLVGLSPIDSANLVTWLDPYVGGIGVGPQWDIDWVEVGATHVLLISVSPPRHGDPPWPIRKEFAAAVDGQPVNIRNGAVYIRRNGKTVEANANELDMLAERARGSARRTDVHVQPPAGQQVIVRAIDTSAEALEPYLAARRERLMNPLHRAQRALSAVPNDVQALPSLAGALGLSLEALGAALSGSVAGTDPDQRSASDYTGEIDGYIEKLRRALPAYLAWIGLKKHLAVLPLEVQNQTEDNFLELKVHVHVSGSAKGLWAAPYNPPALPTPPRPYGPRVIPSFSSDILGRLRHPDLGAMIRNYDYTPQPRGRIRNSGSVEVEHLPVDLRPGETEELDDLLLVVAAVDAGTSLEVTWRATSTSASGRSTGAFAIEVLPNAATPVELLGDGDDPAAAADAIVSDDDEDEDDDD